MGRKHLSIFVAIGIVIAAAGVLVVPSSEPAQSGPSPTAALSDLDPASVYTYDDPVAGAIQPIPRIARLDPDRLALGERLFHEERLSGDANVSCASCHDLRAGGDDGLARSVGAQGATGRTNAPTVFNAVFNFRQFWDGRAKDLTEQIDGPMLAPHEMDGDWESAVEYLKGNASYQEAFDQAYAGQITEHTIKDALVTFEFSLITPNSPFDRYLLGDLEALSPVQLEGYELFLDLGCVTCHQGINIGGNMFQKLGHMRPFEPGEGESEEDYEGRYAVTGREIDRNRFKVPTLRNVARTAPYLHNGSVDDLGETVSLMAYHELGLELSEEEITKVVAFLRSLNGEYGPR